MKRALLLSTALAVFFCLSGLPLLAQGRSGGGMGGGAGMGQGQGQGQNPGMGQGQGPTGERQPGMENPGMGRETTTANGPMVQERTPSQLLQQNTKLSEKLQNLLPAGEKVQDAANGFSNLGQFVAAVHVSRNLNIPFDQLKSKIASGDSLGKAVQTLSPDLSKRQVKAEVKKGKEQAKADIKESHQS